MSPSAFGQRRSALWGVPLLLCAVLAGMLLQSSSPVPERPVVRTGLDLKAGELSAPFRVASFNVLGANHTRRGGTHPGFAPANVRTGYLVELLDLRGLDVAGLQEFQRPQYDTFMSLTQGAWGAYPGGELNNYATHNSIVWRTSEWELVQAKTISVPYFYGKLVEMPYVLLRNLDSGRLVWFANFHNPASSKRRGDQSKWRTRAAALQVQLANQLWSTGVPLILTGDMNEKASYFCKMTVNAPMKSASGGSYGTSACRAPASSRIDWVFGSNFVKFSGYDVRRGPLIRKTTDHPMVIADVSIPLHDRT
jgi:hypothetical protein